MLLRKLLLLAVMIFALPAAFADGGAVLLREKAGAFLITVFASPAPLSVGPADISLLVQKRAGLEPVLDAGVSLLLRAEASGAEVQSRPTREQARNKLLYAANLNLTEPGKWRLAIELLRNGERTKATGMIDVARTREMADSHWGLIGIPPLMIVLFAARERFILRRR